MKLVSKVPRSLCAQRSRTRALLHTGCAAVVVGSAANAAIMVHSTVALIVACRGHDVINPMRVHQHTQIHCTPKRERTLVTLKLEKRRGGGGVCGLCVHNVWIGMTEEE